MEHVGADEQRDDLQLTDLAVCPVCHGELGFGGTHDGVVGCLGCERTYSLRDGLLDLTPFPPPDPALTQEWALWEQLQHNGEVCYSAAPEENLSVGQREDAAAYGRFSELAGLVLDVGCGPQQLPSYGTGFRGILVGIDPLAGVRDRHFLFARAIGEYLPFRDRTFDRVLFATSLDHVMSPEMALREARRVLSDAGAVTVWCSEDPALTAEAEAAGDTPRWRATVSAALSMLRHGRFREFGRRVAERLGFAAPVRSRDYMADLAVPDGAIDRFHAFHLHRSEVEGLLAAAGLRVTSEVSFGENVFVRAQKSDSP